VLPSFVKKVKLNTKYVIIFSLSTLFSALCVNVVNFFHFHFDRSAIIEIKNFGMTKNVRTVYFYEKKWQKNNTERL